MHAKPLSGPCLQNSIFWGSWCFVVVGTFLSTFESFVCSGRDSLWGGRQAETGEEQSMEVLEPWALFQCSAVPAGCLLSDHVSVGQSGNIRWLSTWLSFWSSKKPKRAMRKKKGPMLRRLSQANTSHQFAPTHAHPSNEGSKRRVVGLGLAPAKRFRLAFISTFHKHPCLGWKLPGSHTNYTQPSHSGGIWAYVNFLFGREELSLPCFRAKPFIEINRVNDFSHVKQGKLWIWCLFCSPILGSRVINSYVGSVKSKCMVPIFRCLWIWINPAA